jgi:uracil phosphoribosyltransferase
MNENLTIIEHPLVQHKLTLMRRKETPTSSFRQLLREISMLLAYEVTRDLPLQEVSVETPVCRTKSPQLSERNWPSFRLCVQGMGYWMAFSN